MVSGHTWGGLAARAVFLMSSHENPSTADRQTYTNNAIAGINILQQWYNSAEGLWDSTGWWNSANCLTVLGDFALLDPTDDITLQIRSVIANTFTNAQKTAVTAEKSISASGLVQSSYTITRRDLDTRGFSGFINDFYDDEGWWALALIRSYDLTQNPSYLSMAESIFVDMVNGTDSVCGGGIWWSKARQYKNAIANELYLSVAASLANRAANKQYYAQIAQNEWTWFKNSGMINSAGNINDGLTINPDGSCTNNGQPVWTYNQGVILGGLVELAHATGDNSVLSDAVSIAFAAISQLTDSNGILHEKACEPNCGGDGSQFKGIFARNLVYLQQAAPQDAFKNFITTNADSIRQNDTNAQNQFGLVWSGPPNDGGNPNASTHSSALDAIVGAIAVS